MVSVLAWPLKLDKKGEGLKGGKKRRRGKKRRSHLKEAPAKAGSEKGFILEINKPLSEEGTASKKGGMMSNLILGGGGCLGEGPLFR